MLQLLERGTHSFILGHLSGENNTPELAMRVNEGTMEMEGVALGKDIFIDLARRDEVGNIYEIGADL